MSNALLGQLEGHSLTEPELERLRAFIRKEQDSPLGILLQRVAEANEDGITVNLLADDAELSPNQAAKLMKMSRPHLLRFMRDGDLPFHLVGSHQRIKMSDLRDFMVAREAGAEFVANALHGTRASAHSEYSDEALSELENL
mgnify:CR=1 FL=1